LATYWNQVKKFGNFYCYLFKIWQLKGFIFFIFCFFNFARKNTAVHALVGEREEGLYLRDTYCTSQFLPLLSDGHSKGGIGCLFCRMDFDGTRGPFHHRICIIFKMSTNLVLGKACSLGLHQVLGQWH
jgi:hypothetical protein